MNIFGYFDSAQQIAPTFDPGLDVPCPYCLRPLADEARKTISVMGMERKRSYFYRAHKRCYEHASVMAISQVESSVLDDRHQNRESEREH